MDFLLTTLEELFVWHIQNTISQTEMATVKQSHPFGIENES